MLPTAFLSLSAADEAFVQRVHEHLPDALAYFYPRAFENGESLLSAMEERLEDASVFALFASRQSLNSVWVNFEIDRARIARLKRPSLRLLVFLIDPEVTFADLPEWMREYWVPKAGRSARDIARYIRNVLTDAAMSGSPLAEPIGRGALTDTAVGALQNRYFTAKAMPNVFLFAGHTGIGRKTLKRKFMHQGFPSLRTLNFGPEIQLPQFADSADLYRALRQEIDPDFSLSSFERDAEAFRALPMLEQAREIARNIAYFATIGQAVTLETGNGIYEDRGILKPWVPSLFAALQTEESARLCVVTNRMVHANELNAHPNVLQFFVPPLGNEHVRTIMIATAQSLSVEPQLPNESVISAIGGHPGIGRTTAHLIAQLGPLAVNDNLQDVYNIQEQVLRESLNFDNLTPLERDILSILSWVPLLNAQIVRDIAIRRHSVSVEEFAETVGGLILSCLILSSGPNYLISSPIRSMFRRLHGYGSRELQSALAGILKEEWDRRQAADEFPTELFDAFVYMIALEGGTLPPELRRLLLPSTLQEVVRDTYDHGHDDDAALRRVVSWGLPAKDMKIDETAREEILSYVVRAQTRLQDRLGALATLDFMDARSYRSRFYLRAFYIRLTGGDLNEAVQLLRKALPVRKYRRRVVSELANCYQRLGMWSALRELMQQEGEDADEDVNLLDVKVSMLIVQNDYRRAEAAIAKLRSLPREDGRADSRTAMMMMKRDQNYGGAKDLLTEVLQRNTGGQVAVRRLRAIAAAAEGDFDLAREDIEFLRPRAGGADAALRIEARLMLAQRDYEGAERKLDQIAAVSVQDHLLRARVLEARADDTATPLAERSGFARRATEMRAQHPNGNEFDV